MSSLPLSRLGPALCLALLACPDDEKEPTPACDEAEENEGVASIVPGAPQAGVAEAFVDLPVGTPLSGYTSRCKCFGGDGKADRRDSQYKSKFAPSAGVQTRIPTKAFWIANGDQDLVILKLDVIYSFDGLVEELEASIGEATGRDMDGKVVVATNHSHSSYGDFSDQVTYFLGSDRFNAEIDARLVDSMTAVATEAFDTLQPAKIGVGRAKDWDDGAVYHDRRGDNDGLQFFDGIPAGSYKDPYLSMIRLDTLDDQPIGVLFAFGMHGTVLDGDNPMISSEAPGHVELAVEETFDTPVVVAMLQTGGGDASPGGSDDNYARLESVGEYAAPAIHELWAATLTSADPIRLETASRSIPETLEDIHVTRNGTVDWYYPPADVNYEPDNVVYNPDGTLASPFDEFNTQYGAAFCGEDPPYLAGFAPAQVFPYNQCVDITKMIDLIGGFFDLSEEERSLPLHEATKAGVTATRFGPVPIHQEDGTDTVDDVLIGFFPGEATAMYTEQFRRRAAAELGMKHSIAVGYSQDHEGYLLLPEDWLMGGYEADINVWGPLQAEHIMEGLLEMSKEHLLTDKVEKQDACGKFKIPDYGPRAEMPTARPDATAEAGTIVTENPGYLYSPLWSEDERQDSADSGEPFVVLGIPSEIPRVQGLVQFAWRGGDPGVDLPLVTLQRKSDGGTFEDVLTAAGRSVTSGPDILLTVTPDPLYPADEAQNWTWYAAWQAVGHSAPRTGLPEGVYRLHVEGHSFDDDGATTWPWASTPYTLDSDEFALAPAVISVAASGQDLQVWLSGGERGYRLVGLGGNARGTNPLENPEVTVTVVYGDGNESSAVVTGSSGGGVTTLSGALPADLTDVVEVIVIDAWGNEGSLAFADAEEAAPE
jgi:neutral ceramidase